MLHKQASSFDVRVARGVAYLDKFQPGWHKKINIATLDISSGTTCALAQLADGSWQDAVRVHHAIHDEAKMQPLGFSERNGPDVIHRYQQLTKAWRRAIIALEAGTYVGALPVPLDLAA